MTRTSGYVWHASVVALTFWLVNCLPLKMSCDHATTPETSTYDPVFRCLKFMQSCNADSWYPKQKTPQPNWHQSQPTTAERHTKLKCHSQGFISRYIVQQFDLCLKVMKWFHKLVWITYTCLCRSKVDGYGCCFLNDKRLSWFLIARWLKYNEVNVHKATSINTRYTHPLPASHLCLYATNNTVGEGDIDWAASLHVQPRFVRQPQA